MDIDFITDLSSGSFEITLGDNPIAVTGNRALLNRFEITLLTMRRQFLLGDTIVVDNYGGDAHKFISQPAVLNDVKSIDASLTTAIDMTVSSMQNDQVSTIDDTEKIASAELLSINKVQDMITASIQVVPVVTEPYSDLIFNLPITRG